MLRGICPSRPAHGSASCWVWQGSQSGAEGTDAQGGGGAGIVYGWQSGSGGGRSAIQVWNASSGGWDEIFTAGAGGGGYAYQQSDCSISSEPMRATRSGKRLYLVYPGRVTAEAAGGE